MIRGQGVESQGSRGKRVKGRRVRGERDESREGSAAGGMYTIRRERQGMKETSYIKKRESRKEMVWSQTGGMVEKRVSP